MTPDNTELPEKEPRKPILPARRKIVRGGGPRRPRREAGPRDPDKSDSTGEFPQGSSHEQGEFQIPTSTSGRQFKSSVPELPMEDKIQEQLERPLPMPGGTGSAPRTGKQPNVTEVINKVQDIANSLREVIDELEDVLDMLNQIDQERDADDMELEVLKGKLSSIQRQSDSMRPPVETGDGHIMNQPEQREQREGRDREQREQRQPREPRLPPREARHDRPLQNRPPQQGGQNQQRSRPQGPMQGPMRPGQTRDSRQQQGRQQRPNFPRPQQPHAPYKAQQQGPTQDQPAEQGAQSREELSPPIQQQAPPSDSQRSGPSKEQEGSIDPS